MNPLELNHLRDPRTVADVHPRFAGRTQLDDRAQRAAEAARAARRRGPATWLLEGRGWQWLRPVVDALVLTLAVVLAVREAGDALPVNAAWALTAFPPVVMTLLAVRGMYAKRLRISIIDGVVPVVSAVSLGAIVIVAGEIALVSHELGAATLITLWAFGLAGLGVGRIGCALAQRFARVHTLVGRPTLIVGAGDVGGKVARRLQDNPEYGLRPIGFLDRSPTSGSRVAGLPVLGDPDDVDWIASLSGTEHVVLAFSQTPDQELVAFAQHCGELGLEVSVVPRLFEAVNDRFAYETIGGLPLLALRQTRTRSRRFAVKHGLDRTLAAAALFVLAPMLLAVALAVRLTSPGPVLFRQRRVGRDGREFDLLKFRSMRAVPDGDGFSARRGRAPGGVEGADRRTPIGRALRRTSIDELPQLLNVLRGEMSIVGPRPERPEFVELFACEIPRYGDRHRVRSGITGWAQVHGLRGQTSLADRVEWDNFYIEHWGLALDAKILALTVLAVFRHAE